VSNLTANRQNKHDTRGNQKKIPFYCKSQKMLLKIGTNFAAIFRSKCSADASINMQFVTLNPQKFHSFQNFSFIDIDSILTYTLFNKESTKQKPTWTTKTGTPHSMYSLNSLNDLKEVPQNNAMGIGFRSHACKEFGRIMAGADELIGV
jgi:hypothetical protein